MDESEKRGVVAWWRIVAAATLFACVVLGVLFVARPAANAVVARGGTSAHAAWHAAADATVLVGTGNLALSQMTGRKHGDCRISVQARGCATRRGATAAPGFRREVPP